MRESVTAQGLLDAVATKPGLLEPASITGVDGDVEAISMIEPTEDEVLVKAKQLARDDGRVWETKDIDDAPPEQTLFVDDALRAEYLNRALELLRHERI
jgi:hypothetical protein